MTKFKLWLLANLLAGGQLFSQETNPLLVIRADDMGSFHAANVACVDGYLNGIETSVEVMAVTPWFPEAVKITDDVAMQKILREDLVEKAIKNDIPEMFKVRNISTLENIFTYLCYESGNIISYNKIARTLEEVSVPTVQDYIGLLEKTNLIYI